MEEKLQKEFNIYSAKLDANIFDLRKIDEKINYKENKEFMEFRDNKLKEIDEEENKSTLKHVSFDILGNRFRRNSIGSSSIGKIVSERDSDDEDKDKDKEKSVLDYGRRKKSFLRKSF